MENPTLFKENDFRISSFCALQYPTCVSVAQNGKGSVAVRDTKDPAKTTLVFSEQEWDLFIKGVKNNEFDI